MSWKDITGAAKAAAILAFLSIFVSLSTTYSSVSGGVRSCSFTDYGAIVFGGLAAIAGLVAVLRPGGAEGALLNRSVGALAILIGLWRLAYGFGLVGGPC